MLFRSITGRTLTGQSGLRKLSFVSAPTQIAALSLYNPTEEHLALRQMLRDFVETEVDPQAKEFNRDEKFNYPLFKRLGELGLLGVTVPEEYGGSGMDTTAGIANNCCKLF